MPPITCNECGRSFADAQYLNAHLQGSRNVRCYNAFYHGRRSTGPGLSRPTHSIRFNGTESTVKKIEAILQEQRESQERREYIENADLSYLEFQEEDALPPSNATNNPPTQASADSLLGHPDPANLPTIPDKLNSFRNYVHHAKHNFFPLEANVQAGVELMHLMDECGGSIKLFDAVFEWHQQHLETTEKVTAAQLIKQLEARYNCAATKPYEVPVTLPTSTIYFQQGLVSRCSAPKFGDTRRLPSPLMLAKARKSRASTPCQRR